ncbi:GTP cyclohydrolase II [Oceanisphaera profunda]|uniref:GTP cyclohydrolase-2 n=1 Tax=Oceanisphaera profunda TaxID=1416627 RepID=A0A1Y0D1P7_9GAMM|nr:MULTISPECIES: GTP cyclohydrolase II [Oceanisphaera]ART81433.1 GTP cyclohydrolase II [Oceanisphaera profunda]
MSSVTRMANSKLPTRWGTFTLIGFEEKGTGKDHAALVMGTLDDNLPVLGRIHSECLTGDALFSLRCDCGFQLQAAMERIAKEGRGVLLYVRQEGRGIGLLNKISAYNLQDQGKDTVEANVELGFDADMRDYTICADMLHDLGVKQMQLMTNNPRKVTALESFGIEVTERVPLEEGRNPFNEHYLDTKAGKLGHMFKD